LLAGQVTRSLATAASCGVCVPLSWTEGDGPVQVLEGTVSVDDANKALAPMPPTIGVSKAPMGVLTMLEAHGMASLTTAKVTIDDANEASAPTPPTVQLVRP
jgi:hypothetical protein